MNQRHMVLLAGLLAACSEPRRPAEIADAMASFDSLAAVTADSLLTLSPARQLELSLARNDLRPVGVCGLACMTPGIEAADRALLPTDSMVIVPGTGDAVSGPGMARLNAVADTYATRYNQLLIEHLKSRAAARAPGQGR
jgi:hypothetical protein